ncbi:mitochondrial transcription termination factor family protein isoform X1 [Tasmannia lanceolata]|uniref:mitochondrial transcription termination factor family protein isoform X1 n=1 Tax=Tasmannia lanceolata TaxID=3420 RepID=UPI004062B383
MPVSISHTPICQKWNISSSTYRILFGNFIPRYHLPTKLSLFQTFPPNFNLSVHSNRNHNTLRRFSAEKSIQSSDHESIEARKAVSEILKESGVSEEESLEMALNSPKYVKMLIDSVCELDESSLWDSWKIEKEDIGSLSFKEKVFYMAKEKGDKGILPFLESVGLNQSSLMHVARYLSSEKLVDLIDKVKYVKEMFFSGSDQEGFVGKNARRMMMHLSIFADDDIQQTLSFFEKLEARRGGLNMLDSKDASFPYLIESFPRLLLRSVESHFKPLAEYLESVGVPKGRIRIIILSFPPIVFYDVEKDIKPRLKALGKAGVGEQDVGKMLIKYPWILATSIQENYVDILSFFDMQKVPKVSVDHAIISWPHLLGCSTSKLKSMVEQFAELGVKNKKLGQVIASSPQLLLRKPHEFLEVVSFMEQLGFDEESIGRILSRCPEIFAANVENTLKKKLKFLSELGISDDNLPRVIRKYPELLVSDPNTLLPRMRYLLKIGLSKREVASMVKKFSPLLGYSIEEVLKPKVEFLVCTMGKPVRDVVEYPRYFSYSLEKKIKPRFWVLKGRDVECSLKDMLGKNDEDFAADYMGIGRMLVPPIPGGNK